MKFNMNIAGLLAHLSPSSLVKWIHPVQNTTNTFSLQNHSTMPWVNADKVDVSSLDFYGEEEALELK